MATASELVDGNITLQDGIKPSFNAAIAALTQYLGSYSFFGIGAETTTVSGHYVSPSMGTTTTINDTDIKSSLDAICNSAQYPTLTTILPSYTGLAQNSAATDYKSALFSDTGFSNLKTKLKLVIDNIAGDDDVDSLVTKLSTATGSLQVATFQTDLQRKQQVLSDLYLAADSATGNKGFTYPNSMTVGLKLDAQQKYQFDLATVSREIIKLVYEWGKQEYRFAIENTEKSAGIDIDFNMKYAEACANTYKLALDGVLQTYKEQIAGIIAKFDAEGKKYGVRLGIAKGVAEIEALGDSELSKRYGPHVEYLAAAYRSSIESARLSVDKNIAAADAILKSTIAFSSANSNVGVAILNG